MTTITPAAVFSTNAPFNTSTAYSGTFIPTMWSSKMNAKFYTATVFGEIANTNWEGEVKNMGDKVIINNIPDLTINTYAVGTGLNYQVPTPSTLELTVDKGKYFAFQCNDVLAYQAQPNLIDVFSGDAAMQMKIAIDSTVIFNTYSGAAAANVGATAGVKSGNYALGTNASPLALTGANVLQTITGMSGVLDEQNIPESDRWLLIDPYTRQLLMQSNAAQAQFMGDSQSMVRNGKIGVLDRFTVFVTNNLPRGAASAAMTSGDGSESSGSTSTKRRVLVAGHKSAITFVAQMTKMETVRNPNDFGDYIRGLNVYGYKVVKDTALTYAVVS